MLKIAKKSPEWNGNWTEDVWKTITHLRVSRRDLNIFVVDFDYGLGIITRGTTKEILEYSIKEIKEMSYIDLDENREKMLNLKSEQYFREFLKTL